MPNNISDARINIRSSFRNTMVTLTDMDGNAIAWASAGGRDVAASAAHAAAAVAAKAVEKKIRAVEITVRGPGKGREAAIRALAGAGLEITMIKDKTPIPHNGCRPAGRRPARSIRQKEEEEPT